MLMLVSVPFSQVKPKAYSHQAACHDQFRSDLLAQQHDCDNRTNEWCERKICAGTRASKVPKGQYKQNKADADAEEPEDRSCAYVIDLWETGAAQKCGRNIDGSCHQPLY